MFYSTKRKISHPKKEAIHSNLPWTPLYKMSRGQIDIDVNTYLRPQY